MVHQTFDFFIQTVKNSLEMSRTKLVTTQQLMNTTLFNKSDITPLMAKPYEVVNATNDNNDGSQDVTKPPDKPNG
ncbi:unnamed protein product [Rotaria sp. Silwood1]|nr:unnamed protein product [Rotaria sp. Silwood1]CAF1506727.1 unnamed protein product [Rotaria sp. Silwood1]CAF3572955.1 unnamed protein product [Rotaria sp. Silwood1]CAF3729040.1 unnamed protein product [Rotaria sp. Silwood1]CAF4982768.1 unnamed protein product [Rotaria sp. Silwood1]